MAAILEQAEVATELRPAIAGRNPWLLAGRRLWHNRIAMAALVLFLLIVVVSLLAPLYASHVAHTNPFANNLNGTTQTRASVYFAGTNLVLQNVKLVNKAVRAQLAQSEALFFASGTVAGVTGTLAVNNSSFISNQDTIQTAGRSSGSSRRSASKS